MRPRLLLPGRTLPRHASTSRHFLSPCCRLREAAPAVRFCLSLSPIPLTATAAEKWAAARAGSGFARCHDGAAAALSYRRRRRRSAGRHVEHGVIYRDRPRSSHRQCRLILALTLMLRLAASGAYDYSSIGTAAERRLSRRPLAMALPRRWPAF